MAHLRLLFLLLFTLSAALVFPATGSARSFEWSGYTWEVRDSAGLEGPGPNDFSDSTKSVWVDKKGNLHLRVRYDRTLKQWVSAEVFTWQWFGTGKYTYVVESPGDTLDPNVTVGMYSYLDGNHEIDIEIAKWGDPYKPTNAQYAIQPCCDPANSLLFKAPEGAITYSYDWRPDSVTFEGFGPDGWTMPWIYTGPDLSHGWYSPARINLWQFEGRPPASGRDVEVVLRSFRYSPPA